MKIPVTIAAALLLGTLKLSAASFRVDSLVQQLPINIDSVKAAGYTQAATLYLHYDTISNQSKKSHYEEAAIKNTLLAIKYYSRCNDTTGLRISFDNLATTYNSQKKYSQAKWFILQSNTLSRAKNDVPNIIASLIELATIKAEIKDYDLAMGDLNEALQLSVSNHYSRTESNVQQNYAMLYARMGNYTKEALALKRHNVIDDSIRRHEEAQLMAKIKTADSLQTKKKLYLTSNRPGYFKRIALL